MDGHDAAGPPSKADLRRAQVLEAASRCFRQEGFHNASMSSIANAASMSVGQIYRYFENKEAIIEASVEQSLAELDARFSQTRARANDPSEELMEIIRYHAEKVADPQQAPLSLEFFAEAARNPRIAKIVRLVDADMRARIKDVLSRAGVEGRDEIEARAATIALLLDGWPIRVVKNPDLDRDDLIAGLRPFLERLLCDQRVAQ